MVSNYVKQHIIPTRRRKPTRAEEASLSDFLSSLRENGQHGGYPLSLIDIQKSSYEFEVAYNYFCAEFENLMQ